MAIAVFALPIWLFMSGLQPLAGRTTKVSFNIVVSATIAVSFAANITQFVRGYSRKNTIQRLRTRLRDLERRLGTDFGPAEDE
jgi:hypothetical protein